MKGYFIMTCNNSSHEEISSAYHTVESVRQICENSDGLLAHLYWNNNSKFFEKNLENYRNDSNWLFMATTGHGIHKPPRPTINFFIADNNFAYFFQQAAQSRNVKHGVLIKRATIQNISTKPGYDFVEVQVKYPYYFDQNNDLSEFWKYDIGRHRFASMAELRYTNVARLATPEDESLRQVIINKEDIIAYWNF